MLRRYPCGLIMKQRNIQTKHGDSVHMDGHDQLFVIQWRSSWTFCDGLLTSEAYWSPQILADISLLFGVVNDWYIRETAKKREASDHGTRISYLDSVSCHDIVNKKLSGLRISQNGRGAKIYQHPGSTLQMRTRGIVGYPLTQSFPMESDPNWGRSYSFRCSSTMLLFTGISKSVPPRLASPYWSIWSSFRARVFYKDFLRMPVIPTGILAIDDGERAQVT